MILASVPSPSQGVWHLGPLPIRAYALCIIAGVVVAIWLGEKRWVARGGRPGQVGDIAIWAVPFGLVGDQWRWQVFSGQVPPADYNAAWWKLREQYQGVRPASPRGEQFFDPGAKYHVPANTPYARYFLAAVLQFQFHRELAKVAGCTAPLHRCSIYGNAEAGERLRKALALGASRPWPDVLEALTGQREMDATAIADYFAPLKAWLDEQNAGRTAGW